jgi:glycosyltransferase involved in cell wall biosynthesis
VYPGVPDTAAHPSRPAWAPARYVCFTGTVSKRKNVSTLVAAFERYAAEDEDIALVIIGKRGVGARAIFRAIMRSPVRDRIYWIGYTDERDKNALIANARCFVYPSFLEGFGFPVLEAMQLGVPCIVSDIPVFREVCGNAARFADPYDADSLADAMSELVNREEDRAAYRKRGYRCAAQYAWERAATELLTRYRAASNTTL